MLALVSLNTPIVLALLALISAWLIAKFPLFSIAIFESLFIFIVPLSRINVAYSSFNIALAIVEVIAPEAYSSTILLYVGVDSGVN